MTTTVAQLLDLYATEYLPTKSRTTAYQQTRLYRFLTQELGDILLTDITPDLLRQWRDALLKRYAPGTVRRYMDALSGPLTVAVRDYGWLEEHPMRRVRKPSAPLGRTRFLSEDERVRLLGACQHSRNPYLYPLVVLALYTGARKNELVWLRWQDVDLERGYLRLERTKNGERRAVPVVGEALTLLQALYPRRAPVIPWVFPRLDGKRPTDITAAWKSATKRAGVQDFRFHDLRHTCASYLAMSGCSLRDIAEVLGHKSLQMTLRYAHLTAGHVRTLVERMGEQFLSRPPSSDDDRPPSPGGLSHWHPGTKLTVLVGLYAQLADVLAQACL